MEGPSDKRGGERQPVGLLVRLAYDSVDEFVERFAVNMSRGGLFIRTRDPRPVGTVLALEIRLQTGEVVIRAQGAVRWVQAPETGAHSRPPLAPGMGIQFTQLDDASRSVVDRMVQLREKRGLAPGVAGPAPVAARPTTTPVPTRAPGPAIPADQPGAAPPLAPTPSPTAASDPPVLNPIPRPAPARPSGAPPAIPPPVPAAAPRVPRAGVPGMPAQADLSLPHRIEQLSGGPARVTIDLPDDPVPVTKPSRTIIGIDLGTTNSCAAVVKDGKPYVIPSREGYNTVPSIVALNARNKIVVGHLARAQLLTNPRQTVWGAKRLVGRAYDSPVVQDIKSKFAYEIVAGPEGLAAVRLGSEVLTLEQISALVLREVKEVAQNHVGEEVNRAVITVPAYYNERQRAAVRHAGALAGLQVERILNEPTAAALAYAFGRRVNQRVLVYDLGGGTFDASVLELNDNVFEVISTGGDTFLGGVDFDARIVERLLEVWKEKTGEAFAGDRVALSRLVDAAERAKCALSERTDFPIQLPFLAMKDGRPLSLETALVREELVKLVSPLVDRTVEVCSEVLAAKRPHPGGHRRGAPGRRAVAHAAGARAGGGLLRQGALARRPPRRGGGGGRRAARPLARQRRGSGAHRRAPDVHRDRAAWRPGQDDHRAEHAAPGPQAVRAHHHPRRADRVRAGGAPGRELARRRSASTWARCGSTGLPSGPRGMVKIAVSFELGAECLLTVTARELNTGRQVQAVMSATGGPTAPRAGSWTTGSPRARPARSRSRPPPAVACPCPGRGPADPSSGSCESCCGRSEAR